MDIRKGLVPHAYFDTTSLPPEQRVAAWQQFTSQLHLAIPIARADKPLESISSSWVIGGLIIGWGQFQAQAMCRRHGKQIERNFLYGCRYLEGSSHYIHDGERLDIRPGAFYIVDQGRESRSIATDAKVHGVAIPYELVGYDPRRHPARFVFELDTPAGEMLANTCAAIIEQAPAMTLEEAPEVAALFCGAVGELIHWDAETKSPDPSSRSFEIRNYIAQHPAPGEITVEALANRFAMSRATLYRHFQSYGGLRAYIETQRMDNALRSLAFGPAKRGRVTEVADSLGYPSVKQFSRTFYRSFGLRPSAVVAIFADTEAAEDNVSHPNELWIDWNNRPASRPNKPNKQ